MARARRKNDKRQRSPASRTRSPQRRSPAPRGAASRPSPAQRGDQSPATRAEAALLRLATEITMAAASAEGRSPLRAALDVVAGAHAKGAALPSALFQWWLARDSDDAARLALGWAREQVRVALEEILQRERTAGRARSDVPLGALAWIALAGCEAIAHEPAGTAAERLDTLISVLIPGVDRSTGQTSR
jgi:hypothetical protein